MGKGSGNSGGGKGSSGGGGGGGGLKSTAYSKTFEVPRGPSSGRTDYVHINKSSDGTRTFNVDHVRR